MIRPYVLAETNWKTVQNTEYSLAILPWGATEAHNYHLPYATDTLLADYVAAEAARIAFEKKAKVIVLPTVPFGVNTGQLGVKLCLNMNPSTQLMVLKDLVEVLSHQKIQKLLILNAHGGNQFKPMIRELSVYYPDVFICVVDWYKVVSPKNYFEEAGDHAGELETSAMMHLAPQWVLPLSEAGDGKENHFKLKGLREGWVTAQRLWTEASNDTGIGDPKASTAEKGKAYLEAAITKIADFVVELAACDLADLYEKN